MRLGSLQLLDSHLRHAVVSVYVCAVALNTIEMMVSTSNDGVVFNPLSFHFEVGRPRKDSKHLIYRCGSKPTIFHGMAPKVVDVCHVVDGLKRACANSVLGKKSRTCL
jgi:hypothetical protein